MEFTISNKIMTSNTINFSSNTVAFS